MELRCCYFLSISCNFIHIFVLFHVCFPPFSAQMLLCMCIFLTRIIYDSSDIHTDVFRNTLIILAISLKVKSLVAFFFNYVILLVMPDTALFPAKFYKGDTCHIEPKQFLRQSLFPSSFSVTLFHRSAVQW